MIFAVAIAGPPVVLWYVIRWLGRGLNHRPGIAWAAILFLVAVLVLAALSFQHFFPDCYVWGYMGHSLQIPWLKTPKANPAPLRVTGINSAARKPPAAR